jgi:hypothetical protein
MAEHRKHHIRQICSNPVSHNEIATRTPGHTAWF